MNQGDKERELGLSVTPTMDRTNSNIELSQLAFIDHIIIPLYELGLNYQMLLLYHYKI